MPEFIGGAPGCDPIGDIAFRRYPGQIEDDNSLRKIAELGRDILAMILSGESRAAIGMK